MYLSKTPTVAFDPSNKEHRAAARAFLKRKAWVDSPLRFTHDSKYGSVAGQIEAKLLAWYVAQEEEKEIKKAKPKDHPIHEIKVAGLPKVITDQFKPGTVQMLDSRRKTK